MDREEFTVMTIWQFPREQRRWAFYQMRDGTKRLAAVEGMRFGKLMGSGAGAGFSIRPNWNVYAMFTVFASREAFARFTEDAMWRDFEERSREAYAVVLEPLRAKGTWGGGQPFTAFHEADNGLRAVVTRGSIQWRKLLAFWLQVPATSRAIEQAKRRIFSIGIGELPLIEQATFSLWEDEEAIREYAYRSPAHTRAVRDTHRIGWYSEEMFVRFCPVAAAGTLKGERVLQPFGISSFEDVQSLIAHRFGPTA